jgi:hypothetical protein
MADTTKPDFSSSHSFGKAGTLSIECFNARKSEEVYVVAFGGQSVALTRVDFDNYIADLTRIREQASAPVSQGGA